MGLIKKCPKCGHTDNDQNTYFCTECGTKMEYVEDDPLPAFTPQSTFDDTSSEVFTENNSTQNIYTQQAPQSAPQPMGAPQQYNNTSGSKKVMIGVICACVCICAAVIVGAVLFVLNKDGEQTRAKKENRVSGSEYTSRADTDDADNADDEESDSKNIKITKDEDESENDNKSSTVQKRSYSDDDLINAARNYYLASYGTASRYVDIDSYDGDQVVIHLYDITDGHTVTYDWYTVNIYTGEGYNLMNQWIDIMHPETAPKMNEYILPDSDKRYLQMSDLEGFTAEQCRLARNELFARHGRLFSDESLQAYFNSKSWYVGTILPENFNDNVFNEYEIANRDLIVQFEKERGYR